MDISTYNKTQSGLVTADPLEQIMKSFEDLKDSIDNQLQTEYFAINYDKLPPKVKKDNLLKNERITSFPKRLLIGYDECIKEDFQKAAVTKHIWLKPMMSRIKSVFKLKQEISGSFYVRNKQLTGSDKVLSYKTPLGRIKHLSVASQLTGDGSSFFLEDCCFAFEDIISMIAHHIRETKRCRCPTLVLSAASLQEINTLHFDPIPSISNGANQQRSAGRYTGDYDNVENSGVERRATLFSYLNGVFDSSEESINEKLDRFGGDLAASFGNVKFQFANIASVQKGELGTYDNIKRTQSSMIESNRSDFVAGSRKTQEIIRTSVNYDDFKKTQPSMIESHQSDFVAGSGKTQEIIRTSVNYDDIPRRSLIVNQSDLVAGLADSRKTQEIIETGVSNKSNLLKTQSNPASNAHLAVNKLALNDASKLNLLKTQSIPASNAFSTVNHLNDTPKSNLPKTQSTPASNAFLTVNHLNANQANSSPIYALPYDTHHGSIESARESLRGKLKGSAVCDTLPSNASSISADQALSLKWRRRVNMDLTIQTEYQVPVDVTPTVPLRQPLTGDTRDLTFFNNRNYLENRHKSLQSKYVYSQEFALSKNAMRLPGDGHSNNDIVVRDHIFNDNRNSWKLLNNESAVDKSVYAVANVKGVGSQLQRNNNDSFKFQDYTSGSDKDNKMLSPLLRGSDEIALKIMKHILSMAADMTTLFGKLASSFIFCTVESNQKNPIVFFKNTRQFINGMKNYLKNDNEESLNLYLKNITSQMKPSDILNIDVIFERALHAIILDKLSFKFFDIYNSSSERNNIKANLYFEIENHLKSDYQQLKMIDLEAELRTSTQMLNNIRDQASPLVKLTSLLRAIVPIETLIRDVLTEASNVEKLDALLRLISLSIISSTMDSQFESDYIWHLKGEDTDTSQIIYILSLFSSASQWLRKANVSLPTGLVVVAFPDEEEKILLCCPLPLTRDTQARHISKMMQHKVESSIHHECALYKISDSKEYLLNEFHKIQEIPIDNLHLVYKRKQAQFLWPDFFDH